MCVCVCVCVGKLVRTHVLSFVNFSFSSLLVERSKPKRTFPKESTGRSRPISVLTTQIGQVVYYEQTLARPSLSRPSVSKLRSTVLSLYIQSSN